MNQPKNLQIVEIQKGLSHAWNLEQWNNLQIVEIQKGLSRISVARMIENIYK